MEYECCVVVVGPEAMYIPIVNGMKLTGVQRFFLFRGFQMDRALQTVHKFKFFVVPVRNQV